MDELRDKRRWIVGNHMGHGVFLHSILTALWVGKKSRELQKNDKEGSVRGTREIWR